MVYKGVAYLVIQESNYGTEEGTAKDDYIKDVVTIVRSGLLKTANSGIFSDRNEDLISLFSKENCSERTEILRCHNFLANDGKGFNVHNKGAGDHSSC